MSENKNSMFSDENVLKYSVEEQRSVTSMKDNNHTNKKDFINLKKLNDQSKK